MNTKFKNKRTRFGKYKTSTYKKAYVTLAEGKEINMENPLNKMAIIKAKPTSPGRRFRVQIREELYKGRPEKTLVESKKRISGRNNNGHITVRHKGGGHKRLYRIIDFKRQK